MSAGLPKVAVTWIELLSILLLGMLGMGIWQLSERWAKRVFDDSEPVEAEIQKPYLIPQGERALAVIEEEWKAVLKELVQQRLKITQQTDTAADLETAVRLEERLHRRLRGLNNRLVRVSAQLSKARSAVAEELKEAQEAYERRQRLHTLLLASALAGALLIVFWTPLSWAAVRVPDSFHPDRVILLSAVLLVLLFTYQVFPESWPALAGAVLFALLLVLFFRTVPEHE